MKKILTALVLLVSLSATSQPVAEPWVIWNNDLFFKTSPTDSVYQGPAYLQQMIEIIRREFTRLDTSKLSVNIPPDTKGVSSYYAITSNQTTNSPTLVDVPGMSVALLPNAVYEFDAVLLAGVTNVATGVQYGVNYTGAGARVAAIISAPFTTNVTKSKNITEVNIPTETFFTEANLQGGTRITGSIVTGANPGNFSIKHLKVSTGFSVIFSNSYLKITRIL